MTTGTQPPPQHPVHRALNAALCALILAPFLAVSTVAELLDGTVPSPRVALWAARHVRARRIR